MTRASTSLGTKPGSFRFAQNPDDARAVLAYVRANATALAADPARIVLGGHSVGGWATAMAARQEPGLAGAILISAAASRHAVPIGPRPSPAWPMTAKRWPAHHPKSWPTR